LNRLLAASCWLTLLATTYLSVPVIILHPPRLNYSAWFLMAGFFIAQSVLTLVMVVGSVRSTWARRVLIAGGVAIASTGGWWVHETVSGPHFEGYALILGSWVAIQGTLTVLCLLPIGGPRMIVRSGLTTSTALPTRVVGLSAPLMDRLHWRSEADA
jgi:hypothetical protein